VAGLSDTYVDVDCPGQLKGIQVSLTPTGARRLIGMPLSVLRGRVVSLEDLFPSTRATLIDALESAPDWRTRFKIVEAFIAGEVSKSRVDTGVVDWAVANIVAHNGVLATGELAKELGYSNKHLISLFHEQVGVPPKLMARLVRLHRVMWRIASEEDLCWADLAASHGFCDQAHLGREIRRLSGLTPRQAHTRLFGLRNLLR
jgi:AraC-like DNA-binding protein